MNQTEVRQAVDTLLAHYQRYRAYLADIASIERTLSRQKLRGESTEELTRRLHEVRSAIDALSDAMTFATPRIWVMYKHEAYRYEPQPIRTMHDLRLHCAAPGYICTKRMMFLNDYLTTHGQAPLSDDRHYPDDMPLDELYAMLARLEDDATLMADWRLYEYFSDDGVVKKWQNYISKNS